MRKTSTNNYQTSKLLIRIFENSTDYYNAYATMFYNFYLDFRNIGVIE